MIRKRGFVSYLGIIHADASRYLKVLTCLMAPPLSAIFSELMNQVIPISILMSYPETTSNVHPIKIAHSQALSHEKGELSNQFRI